MHSLKMDLKNYRHLTQVKSLNDENIIQILFNVDGTQLYLMLQTALLYFRKSR